MINKKSFFLLKVYFVLAFFTLSLITVSFYVFDRTALTIIYLCTTLAVITASTINDD